MTPNPIIRLQSLVQTLEHVIVPAVDPGNSLAIEQCGLVLAQLRMLVRHTPFIGEYHALCLGDLMTTVDSIPPAAGGSRTIDAAEALARARAEADDLTDASAGFHLVGRALETLMRAAAHDGDPAYRSSVDSSVLAFSKRQSRRARTWFKDAGFDSNPEELPELADMVAGK